MTKLTRRTVVIAGAVSVASPWVARAAEPEYKLKIGDSVSGDHPLNTSMTKVAARVAKETDGRVTIEVYPKSQLGSEADMLSQVRSGSLEMFANSGVLSSTLVPVASITGVGFAFPDYAKVWEAVDGPLGKYIRDGFAKANLFCLEKSWNHGFRQTTSSTKPIRTPDDFGGFKIRVPPSPLWTSLFKSLGASPVSIPWGETYTAMQTKIADGLEQPLIGILVDKMYEVQKYCSLTNHMWDGFWVLVNARLWEKMPANLRDIVERNINEEAIRQRQEVEQLNMRMQTELEGKGLEFVKLNRDAFRDRLISTGFYQEWQKRYGEEAWSLLEATTGKLS
jgi:TRAP-type transport system periplasmic protein